MKRNCILVFCPLIRVMVLRGCNSFEARYRSWKTIDCNESKFNDFRAHCKTEAYLGCHLKRQHVPQQTKGISSCRRTSAYRTSDQMLFVSRVLDFA